MWITPSCAATSKPSVLALNLPHFSQACDGAGSHSGLLVSLAKAPWITFPAISSLKNLLLPNIYHVGDFCWVCVPAVASIRREQVSQFVFLSYP